MVTNMRYILLVLGIIISLHYMLSVSHEEYSRTTSLSRLLRKSKPSHVMYHHNTTAPSPPDRKTRAAFVVLARNGDLEGVLASMKELEDRFNKKFQYPWVFLNEEPFSDEFVKLTTGVTYGTTHYGVIPPEQWYQPDWIDEDRATKAREKMMGQRVLYAGSVTYRNMCRFNAGFFFRHDLLKEYDYYWRIEPGVHFYCDIDYDPFLFMQDNNKVYGFIVSLYEYAATIPTLWKTTKEFIEQHPEYLPQDNAMSFISYNSGHSYNRCHFWSNFEIGDLNFWRGEAYTSYFEHLDRSGGFYYERWGDAPVHSIGVALFARRDQIHFFSDMGYRHEPFTHCPQGDVHARGKCWCLPTENFDREWYSCLKQFEAMF